jgi:hypothetical protein
METVITDFSIGLFIIKGLVLNSFIIGLYSLIDILRYKFEGNNKLLWFMFVLFIPILDPLSYILIGRKTKFK